jgi:hypothetical protein
MMPLPDDDVFASFIPDGLSEEEMLWARERLFDADVLDSILTNLEWCLGEGLPISSQDLEFAFFLLHHPTLEIAVRAAVFLTGLREKEVVIRLIHGFDALTPAVQEKLIILMIAIENVEVFVFLFSFLKRCQDPLMVLVTQVALAKTDYPILPLLLEEIVGADDGYLRRLEEMVRFMNLSILKSHLRLYPIFPQEKFFRRALGDGFVEDCYQKQ